MDIKETVKHIAKLSNLRFSEKEIEILTPKFERVLDSIKKIEELDLDDIEPMTHVNESYNMLREDEVKESLSTEEALRNAPKKNEYFFKVPKVFD